MTMVREEICRNLYSIAGFMLHLTQKFYEEKNALWIPVAKIFVDVSKLYNKLCIDIEAGKQRG